MGGGKGDAPDPPDYGPLAAASEKAAKYARETAIEQMQWARDRYAEDRNIIDPIIQSSMQRSAMQDQWAQEDRARYQETFKPLEDQMVKEAQEYDTPEKRQAAAARSMATAQNQGDLARQGAMRQLESFGVDPTSTRAMALDRGSANQLAAMRVGAGNQAMQQVEATGQALKANAVNLGKGFQVNPLAASQAGGASGQQAAGNQLGLTASGASTMGTPAQWAGLQQGALGQWGNVLNMGYNNQLAQWNANQQAGGSGIGSLIGLVGAAGTWFADEGGAIPDAPPRAAAALPIGSAARSAPQSPAGARPRVPAGALPTQMAQTGSPVVPESAARPNPSMVGATPDTVPARLQPGEFVVPKRAVEWFGQKHFQQLIAKADKESQSAQAQPSFAMAPAQAPTFASQGIPA